MPTFSMRRMILITALVLPVLGHHSFGQPPSGLPIANAIRIDDSNYTRINLDGSLKLTNFRNKAVEVEVVRHILGTTDSVSHDGLIEKLNVLEDSKYMAPGSLPYWWGYYNWPNWWRQLNGIGRITWKLNLNPGQQIELDYKRHYFWR